MIVALAVVTGFEREITAKLTGFDAHIRILNLDSNQSWETAAVPGALEKVSSLEEEEGIRQVQAYALKAGIIKTREELHGAVLKGVDASYDWDFIKKHMVRGKLFRVNDSVRTNDAIISNSTASLLKLDTGERFTMYFINDPPRARTFTITGIYSTSLEEFDQLYVFADIKQVQRLNEWRNGEVSGYEVQVEDLDELGQMARLVREKVSFEFLEDGSRLKVETIAERNRQIFDWLRLQDMNVVVLVILMLIVAGFNMTSGLLILILERTNMIGIMKALGSRDASIRKIFLYQAAYLAIRGLAWGNLIGLLICLVQQHFQVISLDPSSYYLDTVPINLNLPHLLLLNAGTLLMTYLFLLVPSMIIARISPDKSIKFN